MRPLLLGDVTVAARVLMCLPEAERRATAVAMLSDARVAELHLRDTGMVHPRFGNGSLMAAAMTRPRAPEPRVDDADYARCLVVVLEAVLDASAAA